MNSVLLGDLLNKEWQSAKFLDCYSISLFEGRIGAPSRIWPLIRANRPLWAIRRTGLIAWKNSRSSERVVCYPC